ncbi:MAG TPA: DUF4190 domain-containing protein [Candidatus Dormibacteraeota bacterium]|nr:DUF4190 domain-containing protein [Candidatus Dormibacteraeota bacterium]
MSDREDLYRNWVGWVTTNLGRDTTLTGIAARAATDAAEHGNGFNAAVEAARAAWTEGARIDSDRAFQAEAATIDASEIERWAIFALVFGIVVWAWPVVTVVLLRAGPSASDSATFFLGSAMAIASIAAIPVFAVTAVVYGHRARRRISRYGLRRGAYADAGLILGYAALVTSPVLIGLDLLVALVPFLCCFA